MSIKPTHFSTSPAPARKTGAPKGADPRVGKQVVKALRGLEIQPRRPLAEIQAKRPLLIIPTRENPEKPSNLPSKEIGSKAKLSKSRFVPTTRAAIQALRKEIKEAPKDAEYCMAVLAKGFGPTPVPVDSPLVDTTAIDCDDMELPSPSSFDLDAED